MSRLEALYIAAKLLYFLQDFSKISQYNVEFNLLSSYVMICLSQVLLWCMLDSIEVKWIFFVANERNYTVNKLSE